MVICLAQIHDLPAMRIFTKRSEAQPALENWLGKMGSLTKGSGLRQIKKLDIFILGANDDL